MSARPPLVFKFANEDWEFEAIHRLNYKTFVDEIPQHEINPNQRLVDKFHRENTYLICLSGRTLAGMLAVRGARPFSLDQKLDNLDSYLPAGRKICEIRLLAIEKRFRGAQVLQGILALLWQYGVESGYDLAIISGTTRQLKLYQHLGFIPFGPLVGANEAQFQPMYVTLETFEQAAREFLRSSPSRAFQPSAANFLPGPVQVRREVRRAFEAPPESHRGGPFMADFAATRRALTELVNAREVQLAMGSGTLANDMVAAQISLLSQPGVIATNGEFGERLVDQARRFGLDFQVIESAWGEPLNYPALSKALSGRPAPGWLWGVHCETSTGVLNDLDRLKLVCRENDVKLCLDCISSIGTLSLDLGGVYLASASSGKGLRAYPGVAIVFHQHEIQPCATRLPRYLDIGCFAAQQGIPFTFSSNLLHALQASLKRVTWPSRFAEMKANSQWLRSELAGMGLDVLAADADAAPGIVTIVLPRGLNSREVGARMQDAGYILSFNSQYLLDRNWIQIALMGECTREKLVSVMNALKRVCGVANPKRATEPQRSGFGN